MEPRPGSAATAILIARSMIGRGVYWLGTGDCDTPRDERTDCAGFAINKCYGIPRHRPGFNRSTPGATIVDDINSNSAIEDAYHKRDLFEPIARPELGALLVYPTIVIVGADGTEHRFTGHAAITIGISRVFEWDELAPDYALIDTAQCCGPNGRKPGVLAIPGIAFLHHDHTWPKFEHRTHMLRVIP